MKSKFLLSFLVPLILSACARAPLRGPENAMRRTPPPPLSDDLALDSFVSATKAEIEFLEARKNPETLTFGEAHYTLAEYIAGLKMLLTLKENAKTDEEFYKAIQYHFDFYQVYGQKNWGDVFITTYYEPVIKGSLHRTPQFDTPFYRAPDDLITLNLKSFDSKFESERIYRGRLDGKSFIPYYSRQDIDEKGSLRHRGLEICWVDPIEAFSLQTQGSGTVILGDRNKDIYLNYADKNGQKFEMDSIVETIKPKLPKEIDANIFTVEAYLRTLPRTELQKYLNMNPSYVFFKTSPHRAVTYLGIPATDGRTIATDERYFPKGALAFLQFSKPTSLDTWRGKAREMVPVSRFVFDQDIGGVIKGGGRLDLFIGRGEEQKPFNFSGNGVLYYLAPKK